MKFSEMEKACNYAEAKAGVTGGEPLVRLRFDKSFPGKTAEVFPGIFGTVVHWRGENGPTIVDINSYDLRRYIANNKPRRNPNA